MRALSEFRNRMKIKNYLLEAAACFRRLSDPVQEAEMLSRAAAQNDLASKIKAQAEAEAEEGDQPLRDDMDVFKKRSFSKTFRKL